MPADNPSFASSLPSATSHPSSNSNSSRLAEQPRSTDRSDPPTPTPTPAPSPTAVVGVRPRAAHMFGVVTSRALVDKYEAQEDGTTWALASEWELYGVQVRSVPSFPSLPSSFLGACPDSGSRPQKANARPILVRPAPPPLIAAAAAARQLAVDSSDAAGPTATADELITSTSAASSHAPTPTKLPPGWGSGDRDEFEVPLIVVISVGLTCIVLATIFTSVLCASHDLLRLWGLVLTPLSHPAQRSFLARRNKQRRLARRAKRHEEKKLRRAREAVEAAEAAGLLTTTASAAAAAPGGGGVVVDGETLQIQRVATFSAGRAGSAAADAASIVSSATSSSRSSANRFGGGGDSAGSATGGARQRLGKGRMVGTLRSAGKSFLRISKGKGRATTAPVVDEAEAIVVENEADVVEGSARSQSPSAADWRPGASSYQPSSSTVGPLPQQIVITDTDVDPLPGPPPHPSHHPTPPAYQSASLSSSSAGGGPLRPTRSASDDGHHLPGAAPAGLGSPRRRPTRAHTSDGGTSSLGLTGEVDEGSEAGDHPPPPPTAAVVVLPALPSFPRDAKVPLRPPSPPPLSPSTTSASPGSSRTTAEAAAVLARHARHVATDDKAVLARMAAEGPSAPPEEPADADADALAEGEEEGSAPPVWEAADSLESDPSSALQLEHPSSLPPQGPTTAAGSSALPAPPRQWGQKTLADPYAETTARLLSSLDRGGPSPSYPSAPPPPSPSAPPPSLDQAEVEASAPPFLPDLDEAEQAPTAPVLPSAEADDSADDDEGHVV